MNTDLLEEKNPIIDAFYGGHGSRDLEIIKAAVAKSDPKFLLKGDLWPPLHMACRRSHDKNSIDIIKYLSQNCPEALRTKTKYGTTGQAPIERMSISASIALPLTSEHAIRAMAVLF